MKWKIRGRYIFMRKLKNRKIVLPVVKSGYEKNEVQDMSDREGNHTIISGVQINFGKDNAVIYAEQNNEIAEKRLQKMN